MTTTQPIVKIDDDGHWISVDEHCERIGEVAAESASDGMATGAALCAVLILVDQVTSHPWHPASTCLVASAIAMVNRLIIGARRGKRRAKTAEEAKKRRAP